MPSTMEENTVRYTSISVLFVFVQFFLIGLIVFSGPLFPSHWFLFILEAGGIVLALWSIGAMQIGNFSIAPDVVRAGHLVKRGPYRLVRHPMYTPVLMVCFSLVLNDLTLIRAVLLISLVVTLCLKCRYEESLLVRHYPAYADYQIRTWRIIPFLY